MPRTRRTAPTPEARVTDYRHSDKCKPFASNAPGVTLVRVPG